MEKDTIKISRQKRVLILHASSEKPEVTTIDSAIANENNNVQTESSTPVENTNNQPAENTNNQNVVVNNQNETVSNENADFYSPQVDNTKIGVDATNLAPTNNTDSNLEKTQFFDVFSTNTNQ